MTSIRRLLCALLISFGFMACDGIDDPFIDDDDDDDDVDELIVTTSVLDNWWTWSVFAMTDPLIDPPADAATAAQIVADSVDQYFMPAGCASVERDGSALIYELTDCSGPLVPASIDGTLAASFSMVGEAIEFDVSSRDLEINGVPAVLSVTGSYGASGAARTVEYVASPALSGIGDGFSANFHGTVTWTAGSNCIRSDGDGQLTLAGRSWDATLAGFARCADACPTAGVVTLSDAAEIVTLTFDGGADATLLHSGGVAERVDLDCGRSR